MPTQNETPKPKNPIIEAASSRLTFAFPKKKSPQNPDTPAEKPTPADPKQARKLFEMGKNTVSQLSAKDATTALGTAAGIVGAVSSGKLPRSIAVGALAGAAGAVADQIPGGHAIAEKMGITTATTDAQKARKKRFSIITKTAWNLLVLGVGATIGYLLH